MMLPGKWIAVFVAVVAGLGMQAGAQTSYTVTEVVSMFGPNMNTVVYRDGTKAMMDESHGPDKDNAKGYHVRIWIDLATHTNYSLDLINTGGGCGTGSFSGDWGDPFAMSSGMMDDLVKQGAKVTGSETINGLAAKVYEAMDKDSKIKAWVDAKSGLLLKAVVTAPTGEAKMLIEVKQVSMVAPAASVLKLPAECSAAALAPKAPTEDEEVAAETGGHAGDYVKAIMPPAAQPTTCSVMVRVVKAVTMEPITSGFQIAVDTTYDVNHPPSYKRGTGANGKETVSGGGIKDMTALMKNGALRLDNLPAYFNLETYWGDAGDGFALIYKQCFGPQTTLLFVVTDPSNLGKGGDWLWAKSGKFAGH